MHLQKKFYDIRENIKYRAEISDLLRQLKTADAETIVKIASEIDLQKKYRNARGVNAEDFLEFIFNLYKLPAVFPVFFKYLNKNSLVWFLETFRDRLAVTGFDEDMIPAIPRERIKELPEELYNYYKKFLLN